MAAAITVQRPEAQVECLDVLTYAPRWFRAGYGWTYLFLVRHLPWVWRFSYAALEQRAIYRLVQPFRRAWNLCLTRRFARYVNDITPALVVVTHFLAADVCSAGKRAGWLRSPLVVVVTDWHPHRFWLSPEPDAIVVSTERAASVCGERGVDPAKVHVRGIPIGQSFSAVNDLTTLRHRLQLDPSRHTVLVTSGGTTVGQFERVIEYLVALEQELPQQLQLLIVCGEDEAARRRLVARAQGGPMPMRVFGFVDTMAELMAASDLIVAKAGGLTVSEALGVGRPLILYHVIPGQERMNAQYVVQHGAAVMAPTPRAVASAVRRCLDDPAYFERLRQAAKGLSRPDAAESIAVNVVAPLLQAASHKPQASR